MVGSAGRRAKYYSQSHSLKQTPTNTATGTFGVITSVTLKAHPALTTITSSLQLTFNPSSPTSPNRTTFWRAISSVYHFTPHILSAGGYTFSYIRPNTPANSSITFTISHTVPNISVSAYRALLRPLYTNLSALLPVPISLPTTLTPTPYAGNGHRTGSGDSPINTRYHSRLFPSSLWDTTTPTSQDQWTTLWETEGKGIRAGVEEGGYVFHGIGYAPTREVAGWPGRDSAVNPAWRGAWLHGSLMDVQREGLSAGEVEEREERARGFLGGCKYFLLLLCVPELTLTLTLNPTLLLLSPFLQPVFPFFFFSLPGKTAG